MYKPRLQKEYEDKIVALMQEQFGYDNPMKMPKITKIVINMGVGEAAQDKKHIMSAVEDLTAISGQKPVTTKARMSNASFKIRQGQAIGAKVTLRRQRMYEFLDRLVTIALPRVRDFRGISHKSFDGRGNYALGIKEHIIFPEINYDNVDQIRGMDIVICTNAANDDEARELLRAFKLPFQDKKES